jgi:hypothetical protein
MEAITDSRTPAPNANSGLGTKRVMVEGDGRDTKSQTSLHADIIIANAPDPVFVSERSVSGVPARGLDCLCATAASAGA